MGGQDEDATGATGGPQQAGSVAEAALRVMAAVLGAPGNAVLACKRAVDFHVHFHFLHFAKLFHGPLPRPEAPTLCRLHLQVFGRPHHPHPARLTKFCNLRQPVLLVLRAGLWFSDRACGASHCGTPASSRTRLCIEIAVSLWPGQQRLCVQMLPLMGFREKTCAAL